MTVGSALYRAVDLMLEKAKPIAAGLLEAAEADVTYQNGNFLVVGTDRRVSLFEVAARDERASGDTLDTKATVDTPQTFPNGCHVAEVEIDPETGVTEIVAYAAVDDAGVVLDHTLVEGQLRRRPGAGHRAGAAGERRLRPGQRAARHRHVHGLRDAARGGHAAGRGWRATTSPATTNPLGVKGVGEAGTTGSIAAIMNAIANAIPRRPRRRHRDAGDAREGVGGVPAGVKLQAADCSGAGTIEGYCGASLPRLTSSGATSTRLRPRALAR